MSYFKQFLALLLLFTINLSGQNKIMVIEGNSDWVDVGYNFDSKSPGFVFASGYVIRNNYSKAFDNYATPSGRAFADWNPNAFPCQTCGATSLIGKVGRNGTPFLIGERAYINKTGRLYLRINDTPLRDNRGAFVVVIYKNYKLICSELEPTSFEDKVKEEFGEHKIEENFGLESNDKEAKYKFSPNPAKDYIQVKFLNLQKNTRVRNIRLFNLNGELVYEYMYKYQDNGRHKIDTSKLDKGLYMLSIEINGEAKNKKVVIK